jgi:C1A family cysteine protease
MSNNFESLFANVEFVDKAELEQTLKKYFIVKPEQLYGALNPDFPDLPEEQMLAMGYDKSFVKSRKNIVKEEHRTAKIIKTFGFEQNNAEKFFKILSADDATKIVTPSKHFDLRGLGYVVPEEKTAKNKTFLSAKPNQKTFSGDHYLLPDYDARIGKVFDQGGRGTCVANAACGLLDYITSEKSSRQFHYHQCKMIDGIKDSEGTYCDVALYVICDPQLIDFGVVEEHLWPYNPNKGSTTHQGPPPENCFSCDRYFADQIVFARGESYVDDIKTILLGFDGYPPLPVLIGASLYESFRSANTRETGWVTMPLPGESRIGGHAMLIVGFSDELQMFIVRNSWGDDWAYNNPLGYPGHALIPYPYIEQYVHEAGTILDDDVDYFDINEQDRLYNRSIPTVPRVAKITPITSPDKKRTTLGWIKYIAIALLIGAAGYLVGTLLSMF